ncbi:MAG: YdiU family protein [Rhodospirillaceae bacterium]|nr:MAG: YdiU family protein [Rhodospirillaceae bacterium]
MSTSNTYRPSPVHRDLGERFFDAVTPAAFPAHRVRYRNQRWAQRVGLAGLDETEWRTHFGQFAPLAGNLAPPLALRYHGHQFRVYNPDLGDGRGFLFAQLRDGDNRVLDLGTKGSGQTPYSRSGDGRLTLKGGVRELLATTLLEALGVDTSKTFSLIETGERLTRNDEPSPTRSGVLVRLSHSHIRFGTFQRLAYEEDAVSIQRLIDHVLVHYMPDVWRSVADRAPGERAAALLAETVARVARTGAQWMAAGFVHGVLNTDNINVTGESFDYGPYRFLPHYDPGFTAAYFDRTGLYAYGRQPEALAWNLERLAECLRLVCDEPPLIAALRSFADRFETALVASMLNRLNLTPLGGAQDMELVGTIYQFLHDTKAPFEQFFFDWHGGRVSESRALRSPVADRYGGPAFASLKNLLAPYGVAVPERLTHPYFAGERPATLLIDEIEEIWSAIAEDDNWRPLEVKCAALELAGQALGTMSLA